jgi:hypothetical protein
MRRKKVAPHAFQPAAKAPTSNGSRAQVRVAASNPRPETRTEAARPARAASNPSSRIGGIMSLTQQEMATKKQRLGTSAKEAAEHILVRELDAMFQADYHAKDIPQS